MVRKECQASPALRLNCLLAALGIARSAWYAKPAAEPGRAGRKPKGVPEAIAAAIRELAERYPRWGYKRIAVVARREGLLVTNKQV
jgi:hypothetical protein